MVEGAVVVVPLLGLFVGVLVLWLALGACVALLWLALCVCAALLCDALLCDELLCAVLCDCVALLCVALLWLVLDDVLDDVLALAVDPCVTVLCVVVAMLDGITPPSSRCGTMVSLRNRVGPDVSPGLVSRLPDCSELFTNAPDDAVLVVLDVAVVRAWRSGLALRLLA